MCLTTGEIKGGKSTKWIPAWKEVENVFMDDSRVCTAYRGIPLLRRMVESDEYDISMKAYGNSYRNGFHAWLKPPNKYNRVYKSTLLRCFIRKVTAVGTQDGTPAIVGREIFIPALKMDGTRKKQGNPKRKK